MCSDYNGGTYKIEQQNSRYYVSLHLQDTSKLQCVEDFLEGLLHACWPTLQQRRNLASVTMLYKLQHQLITFYVHVVSISNLHYLVPSRDHKFIQPLSPTNYHLYSFFPRTIRLWNSLPNQVANSPDLDAFKFGAKSFLYC